MIGSPPAPATQKPNRLVQYLPRIGSPAYHLMLACVAIFILGPLGGIAAAFMSFSIGFYVSGSVLAGILGSSVTLPYGPEGKHGANYMQTMATSVAGMAAMAVLIQAAVWLGLPQPPAWQLVLYYMSIGMFGVGVGMLYTPLLVDRMQLTYPSGFAVANILRALTDPSLLKRSIAKLGGSMLGGYGVGLVSLNLSWLMRLQSALHQALHRVFSLDPRFLAYFHVPEEKLEQAAISPSSFGAGMIVGARLAIPALVIALIGHWQTPHLVRIGWLQEHESYRKTGFMISLGGILGAAALDITLLLIQAVRKYRQQSRAGVSPAPTAQEDWKRVNTFRLTLWVLFWGVATIVIGSQVLHQPIFYLTIAVLLCFLFVLVNGISQGISDWNPISSAFVASVLILAALGLHEPGVGLFCASILFIACAEGCDMQQDRSTGWRLGTNRVVQFRYQVIGIIVGAILAVLLAKLFMSQFTILQLDQFTHPHAPGSEKWQSALTFKLVGALRGITQAKPHMIKALWLGIAIGLGIEITKKLIKRGNGYKRFARETRIGRAFDFVLDAILLPNPYASALGGFVELPSVLWWTSGGVFASLFEFFQKRRKRPALKSAQGELPADMSTVSLVGGGLIAGEALSAVSVGLVKLIGAMLR
ncbi:MAG: peptide transporter [Verrucomicrobia bacterium]|nr:MAG: peptide transporter [Verrucomicrobiota bacterium]